VIDEPDSPTQKQAEIARIKAVSARSAHAGIKPEELQNLMGGALARAGFGDAAIACFEAAAKINPDNVAALNNIGNVLLERGATTAAIKQYEAAIKINPDFAMAYCNLGNALQLVNDAESAIRNYRLALQIDPGSAVVHNNMGNALRLRNEPAAAIESYSAAIALNPDYAEAHLNIGIILKETFAPEAAITHFEKAIELDPQDAEAHSQLAHSHRLSGNIATAITHFKKSLEINPDNALDRHILAASIGDKPAMAPRSYVEPLFDRFAADFERSLVQDLAYKTPKLLVDLVTGGQNAALGAVLDLGCGTGLAGDELRAGCDHLVGIDLSAAMLALAEEKSVYDQLVHTDLDTYLANEPLDFDLFIAADVMVYIGDLSNVFRLVKSRNQRAGKLVFSTEHAKTGDYTLNPSGRYAHSKSYIEALCQEYGYRLAHFGTADLRKEKGAFLTGGLYVLEF